MRRRRGAWIEAFSQAFAFFGGTIASFAALAIRNFTTFLAAILMASPVAGLRPMRALRSTRTSRPIPGRTNTPFFLTSLMAVSDRAASKPCETFLLTSHFSANAWTICDCVIVLPFGPCRRDHGTVKPKHFKGEM